MGSIQQSMNIDTELRHITDIRHIIKLCQLLDRRNAWIKLMEIIPNEGADLSSMVDRKYTARDIE